MSEIRRKVIEGINEGETFTVRRTFTEEQTRQFADLTLDYNPIHFDSRFTDLKKFPRLICHGLLVGSMLTEIGGQLGMLASGMSFRFRKPVYFGETITCHLTIDEIDDRCRTRSSAVFTNQDGETVLEAQLQGILPGEPEQAVMRAMVDEGDPTNKLRSD